MPTNLYGPGDNYHPQNSHVIPGMIYRFHKAKIKNLKRVAIWGTGTPKREFLYVEDMARASIHLMNIDKKIYDKHTSSMCSHINVGSGYEISIYELAKIIKEVVKFNGEVYFDHSKPDGNPRKFLNSHRINKLGFKPKTSLIDGIKKLINTILKLNGKF